MIPLRIQSSSSTSPSIAFLKAAFEEGDVVKGVIKKVITKNEAIITTHGQELRILINQPVHLDEAITIKIEEHTGEAIKAMILSSTLLKHEGSSKSSPLFMQASIPQNHVQQFIQVLVKKGYSINPNTQEVLEEFIRTVAGSPKQQEETIKMIAKKQLAITSNHLKSVHQALHYEHIKNLLQEYGQTYTKTIDEKRLQELVKTTMQNLRIFYTGETLLSTALLESVGRESKFDEIQAQLFNKSAKQIIHSMKLENEHVDMITKGIQLQQVALQNLRKQNALVEQPVQQERSASIPQSANKTVVKTTITPKVAESIHEFQRTRADVNKQLLTIRELLGTRNSVGNGKILQHLDKLIKQIDFTILKSDFVLYGNMKSEKQLLEASQQLQAARQLLVNNQSIQAGNLIKQVQGLMVQVQYKPSEQKIIRLVNEQLLETPEHHVLEALPFKQRNDASARDIFELIKKLGVNREQDIVKNLNIPSMSKDLKSLLMEEGVSSFSHADQALQSLTGQQLLNKQDAFSQQLYMQLPFMLQGEVANMKIYVHSQKKHQQIDWENSSLYFLFESPTFGEIGILLTSVNRQLSIQFQNEGSFQSRVEPFVEELKERIEQIGYYITGISYSSLSANKKAEAVAKNASSAVMKGFDYSV